MKKYRNRVPDSVFSELLRAMDKFAGQVWAIAYPLVFTALCAVLLLMAADIYVTWVKHGRPVGCNKAETAPMVIQLPALEVGRSTR